MADLSGTYLFGAHCYRVPSPPLEDVFADMATMKRLGMNLANIGEAFRKGDPVPVEQFDIRTLVVS